MIPNPLMFLALNRLNIVLTLILSVVRLLNIRRSVLVRLDSALLWRLLRLVMVCSAGLGTAPIYFGLVSLIMHTLLGQVGLPILADVYKGCRGRVLVVDRPP